MDGKPGDLLLFAADKNKIVWNVLGALRLEIAKELDLLDPNQYNFLWITEFPLLEWSDEENRYMAMHHPFTMPMEEDWDKIDTDPGAVRAKAYDIVLNGTELPQGRVGTQGQAQGQKVGAQGHVLLAVALDLGIGALQGDVGVGKAAPHQGGLPGHDGLRPLAVAPGDLIVVGHTLVHLGQLPVQSPVLAVEHHQH